ncbi:MAG: LexA family protein [Acidobacteriaceae bacterium]|jgi:DNA-binding MarR family transcriptional regulator
MSRKGMTSSRVAQEGTRRKSGVIRKPTAHQRNFLNTIRRLTRKSGGLPPTLIELAEAIGVTKATVQTHVRRMRERGWILPSNGKYRNIRVA